VQRLPALPVTALRAAYNAAVSRSVLDPTGALAGAACVRACDRAFSLLASVREIVDVRPDGSGVPAWCSSCGWDDFLLGLADDDLVRCEEVGLARALHSLRCVPPSLAGLASEVEDATRVPRAPGAGEASPPRFAGLRPRKERQVRAMLELGRELAARSSRLVDVGCGRGRFTEIAALEWDRPAIGIEREPERVAAACSTEDTSRTEFLCLDVGAELSCFAPGDFVLGLHACGDLGDAIVRTVARAGSSLLLVACCHQKIRGPRREPLSRRAAAHGLSFAREVLGLANLTSRAAGVEGSLAAAIEARAHRHALGLLLHDRGVSLPLDTLRNMRGRRESFADWGAFARRALAALELSPPGAAELEDALARGREELGRHRRLSLPRHLLSRLLELAIALDRAAHLAEAGLERGICEVFESEASPRNLALTAARLPSGPV
jgi:SAM-dependent methyltransferase